MFGISADQLLQIMHEFGGCVALALLLIYLHRDNILRQRTAADSLKMAILYHYHGLSKHKEEDNDNSG